MKVPNLERRQQLSSPSSRELELPSECGLQPPGKRSGSGAESEEASELEAPSASASAEETGSRLSPGELPQLPRTWSILEEEQFAEATEEAEEGEHRAPHRGRVGSRRKGWNSCEEASNDGELQCQGNNGISNNPQGQQRRKARAKKLEGPWDLEKLQRQLQQDLDCGEYELNTWVPQEVVQ